MTRAVRQPMALGDDAARQLANTTKTVPQMDSITRAVAGALLNWIPVEAGIYLSQQVIHPESVQIQCDNYDESPLPDTFVDYEQEPRSTDSKPIHNSRCTYAGLRSLFESA